jgi:hypothetical protein
MFQVALRCFSIEYLIRSVFIIQNFQFQMIPISPLGERRARPVKVVRAGAGGNGFVCGFREVGLKDKIMTRVEGSL